MPKRKKTAVSLTPEQDRYISTLPASYQDLMSKAYSGVSMAAAVKAKCRDCVGFESAAERVRTCNITTCPLWAIRR